VQTTERDGAADDVVVVVVETTSTCGGEIHLPGERQHELQVAVERHTIKSSIEWYWRRARLSRGAGKVPRPETR
jgi:hypothetical protein